MRKLKINGSVTTDPFNILSEQRRFIYQQLFMSRNKNNEAIESFLKDILIPKLSEEQKMSCEGKTTSEECALLLECFQNTKTPRSDGIPIEFYKKFWPLISEPFIQCTNECFEKGDNWQPISLVNVDAKIMSKAIATGIKNVLPNIIHHNQTGFIEDRYIGEQFDQFPT